MTREDFILFKAAKSVIGKFCKAAQVSENDLLRMNVTTSALLHVI